MIIFKTVLQSLLKEIIKAYNTVLKKYVFLKLSYNFKILISQHFFKVNIDRYGSLLSRLLYVMGCYIARKLLENNVAYCYENVSKIREF